MGEKYVRRVKNSSKKKEIRKVTEMIPLKSKEEVVEFCYKHSGNGCPYCKKEFPELKKICDKNFPGFSRLTTVIENLFPLILIHNRKEKLKKLLK